MDFGHCHSSADGPAIAEAHRPLCHCLDVTESEIRKAISAHEPQTVQGVSQICGAGGGCMSCHRHIRRMLNERVLSRRSDALAQAAEFA
jgi:bacterioferritin-associated ferredoxin